MAKNIDTNISKTPSPLRTSAEKVKTYGGEPPKKSIEQIDASNTPPVKPPTSGSSTSVRV